VCGIGDGSGHINWAVQLLHFGAGSDVVQFNMSTSGGTGQTVVTQGITFVANTWYAVAAVYSGGTNGKMYAFINGVAGAGPTIVVGTPLAPYATFNFGGVPAFAVNAANTQVDELRITKGVARYISSYT